MDFSNKQNLQKSLADQWMDSTLSTSKLSDSFKKQEYLQPSKSIFECLQPYLESIKDPRNKDFSKLMDTVNLHEIKIEIDSKKIKDLEVKVLAQENEISKIKENHRTQTLTQEKKFADYSESTNKKLSEYDALFITLTKEISISHKCSSSKGFLAGFVGFPVSLLSVYMIVNHLLHKFFP